jgi:addiction module HigA family antidote
MAKTTKLLPPVYPGEILLEDFMKPLRLTVNKLAIDLHVPATRIGEIVHQRRRITADMLCVSLDTSKPILNSGSICKLSTDSSSPAVPASFPISSATSTQPRSWSLKSALPEKPAEIVILSRSSFSGLRHFTQLAGEN